MASLLVELGTYAHGKGGVRLRPWMGNAEGTGGRMSRIGEVKFHFGDVGDDEFMSPAARSAPYVREIGRIYLGQAAGFQPTPVEIAGFLGGLALLVTGVVVKKNLGTALGVVGGVAAGVSGGSALVRAIGGAQGTVIQTAPAVPGAPTFTPPPPSFPAAPKPPSTPTYAKVLEYGKQYLPVLQELVKGVFSPAPAPASTTPKFVTSL